MPDRQAPAAYDAALDDARRREKISQAQWRRHRAEVARLVAAGEEAAAIKLLREAGIDPVDLPETKSEVVRSAHNFVEQAVETEVKANTESDSEKVKTPAEAGRPAKQRTPDNQASSHRPTRSVQSRSRHPKSVDQGSTANPHRRPRQRVRATGWIGWVRRRPPWLLSFVGHAILLLALGLLSFGVVGEPGFELIAFATEEHSANAAPMPIEFVDLAVDAPSADNAPAAIDLTSLLDPIVAPSADAFGDSLEINAAALAATVPGGGSGKAGSGAGAKPTGSPGKVRFFGAESAAERVVFVVDNSGSMQRGRLETTLFELERAVQGLSSSQEFYVVFFSDQAYPMFFPDGIEEPIPASLENKRRLSAWLHTVEMCLGGRLLDAMELASATEPDVVYLLTDGDIRSERIVSRMTAQGAWPFPIHTLGMGARTAEHLAILQVIASRSGGKFRPVAANPAAVRRAAARPIRYHRKTGTIWGSKVQAWD